MALVAGTLMGWEVLLTRLASLRYHFHFGHLAVSNGLLGIGAAGCWLAITREQWRHQPWSWLKKCVAAYCLSLIASILVLYVLPVHLGPMNTQGTLLFSAFILGSLTPFLSGGMVVGLILSAWPRQASTLYGADLIAAGLACVLTPLLLPLLGMAGAVGTLILLSLVAAWICMPDHRWALAFIAGVVVVVALRAPLAPSKITRNIVDSTWTPLSRVDLVEVPDAQRTIRARGIPVDASQVPPQIEIMQDGSASTLLSNFSDYPESRSLLKNTLYGGAATLKPDADVLIIGFGGADDVWAVLGEGAAHVQAVDLHAPVLAAHTHHKPNWSKALLDSSQVDLRVAEGRSTLMRTDDTFDVVQLTGIDTWTALNSGAYMLAENYLYTTEAFANMLDRLRPHGVLQIIRMAAEMEALRVLVQLREALKTRTDIAFHQTIAVFGSVDHQVATLCKPHGFSEDEIESLQQWATDSGFTTLHLPGPDSTVDSSNWVSRFVFSADPQQFIDTFPRHIAPTHDDSPYFFQFTRWTQPSIAAQTIREPTYISQGNPLWLLGMGGYSIAMALLLLYGPFVLGIGDRGQSQTTRYFAGIGVGYVMIELALMHKLGLLLGHPMLSFSVVLASMLLSSGVGSLLSTKIKSIRWVVGFLCICVAAIHWGLESLTYASADWHQLARIAVAVGICFPIGLVLGFPFVYGLRSIDADQVPWAWATNALFSVIGALAVIVVSMTVSFSAALALGLVAYLIALTTRFRQP